MHVKVPKKTLGRNVFLLRLWWEWDVARLARKAHVPVSVIRQIEQDRADPTLSQLRAVADALKVREADLLRTGEELLSVSPLSGERIRRKFSHGKTRECWIWRGAKRGIYGVYQMDGERCYPHRLVYAMKKPLMKNWDLDHTCKNPMCVNPEHLEVVTRGTNLSRRDRRRMSQRTQGVWEKLIQKR